MNLLETSAYSPLWHLCRSLTWPPKPQDTLTDRLTHKHTQTPMSCRALGMGEPGGGKEAGVAGCCLSKAPDPSGSDVLA